MPLERHLGERVYIKSELLHKTKARSSFGDPLQKLQKFFVVFGSYPPAANTGLEERYFIRLYKNNKEEKLHKELLFYKSQFCGFEIGSRPKVRRLLKTTSRIFFRLFFAPGTLDTVTFEVEEENDWAQKIHQWRRKITSTMEYRCCWSVYVVDNGGTEWSEGYGKLHLTYSTLALVTTHDKHPQTLEHWKLADGTICTHRDDKILILGFHGQAQYFYFETNESCEIARTLANNMPKLTYQPVYNPGPLPAEQLPGGRGRLKLRTTVRRRGLVDVDEQASSDEDEMDGLVLSSPANPPASPSDYTDSPSNYTTSPIYSTGNAEKQLSHESYVPVSPEYPAQPKPPPYPCLRDRVNDPDLMPLSPVVDPAGKYTTLPRPSHKTPDDESRPRSYLPLVKENERSATEAWLQEPPPRPPKSPRPPPRPMAPKPQPLNKTNKKPILAALHIPDRHSTESSDGSDSPEYAMINKAPFVPPRLPKTVVEHIPVPPPVLHARPAMPPDPIDSPSALGKTLLNLTHKRPIPAPRSPLPTHKPFNYTQQNAPPVTPRTPKTSTPTPPEQIASSELHSLPEIPIKPKPKPRIPLPPSTADRNQKPEIIPRPVPMRPPGMNCGHHNLDKKKSRSLDSMYPMSITEYYERHHILPGDRTSSRSEGSREEIYSNADDQQSEDIYDISRILNHMHGHQQDPTYRNSTRWYVNIIATMDDTERESTLYDQGSIRRSKQAPQLPPKDIPQPSEPATPNIPSRDYLVDDEYWSARSIVHTLSMVLQRNPPLPDTLRLTYPERSSVCFRLYLNSFGLCDWRDLASEIGLENQAIEIIDAFTVHHGDQTAGEIVLRHWQYRYNRYGQDDEKCPVPCTRKGLIDTLESMQRMDIVEVLQSGNKNSGWW